MATIHKTQVIPHAVVGGASDDMGQRRFAQAVGRRFSRHAFPDEIVPWLTPLRSLVERNFKKEDDALRAVFDEIDQFRIESSSWSTFPAELTLHVIVRAGELPRVGDDPPLPSADLVDWLNIKRSVAEIAGRLFPKVRARPQGDDRQILWGALGDALIEMCKPARRDVKKDPSVLDHVRSREAIVGNDEELTLAQFRHSERLDLSHLSEPQPHED